MNRPFPDAPMHPILDRFDDGYHYDTKGLDHESWFAGQALIGLLSRPDAVSRPDIQGLCDLAWEFGRRMCHRPQPARPPVGPVTVATITDDDGDIPL